ncbi:flagellin N-terminal helical domain-containing protein [Flexibacterium corallicola]|uniref:flagellin N-terminal helical domain-containing protein n=1 Tax=Flexibacterium corallicola TaxID=3037259 RepID=UPI00286F813A|nr:flagellin [Pseudovibrio sp. M1P-2-3]
MSSLLTNSSSMVALQTMRSISADLSETQSRISTGLRVQDASDNAAYWSIATTMRSDNNSLSTVQDSLGLGAATVDVAFTAMEDSLDYVDQIKQKIEAAKNGTIDKNKAQSDIDALQEQLQTIAESASFSGENWLQQDMSSANMTKQVVGSFTRDTDGNISLGNIEVDTSVTTLVDTRATTAGANTGILTEDLVGTLGNDPTTFDNYNPTGNVAPVLNFDTDATNGEVATSGIAMAAYQSSFDALLNDGRDVTQLLQVTPPGGGALVDSDELTQFKADWDAAKLAIDTGLSTLGTSVLDFDISALGDTVGDRTLMDAVIVAVDQQYDKMTDAATALGSAKSRVDMQMEFSKNLSDAIERGIGQLVDADMNEESTRLSALQTQEQLGIQALSIANSSSQNILSLFR